VVKRTNLIIGLTLMAIGLIALFTFLGLEDFGIYALSLVGKIFIGASDGGILILAAIFIGEGLQEHGKETK